VTTTPHFFAATRVFRGSNSDVVTCATCDKDQSDPIHLQVAPKLYYCQCGYGHRREDVSPGHKGDKSVWFCNYCIPF